jgi:hypothetical protein
MAPVAAAPDYEQRKEKKHLLQLKRLVAGDFDIYNDL